LAICKTVLIIFPLNLQTITIIFTLLTDSKSKKSIETGTNVEEVSDETVSNDGDGALPESGAVQLVVWIEGASQQSEADQRVDIEHYHTQDCHPQQRLSYIHTRKRIAYAMHRRSK